MTVFPKIIKLMKENNLTDVLLTGGGIIPEEDRIRLQEMVWKIICTRRSYNGYFGLYPGMGCS
jgi:methylmalonyl-CoA mutase cobalamin-binding subunit